MNSVNPVKESATDNSGVFHTYLLPKLDPKANEKNVFSGEGFRVTVLTPKTIRVEINKNNVFCDEATQGIWFRNFGEVPFEGKNVGQTVTIETDERIFNISVTKKKLVSVFFKDKKKWVNFKKSDNMGGTMRTLDMKNGRVKLEDGFASKSGIAVLNDSGAMLLADGTIQPREKTVDFYVFSHGKDFYGATNDYFLLTGKTPMIPKYALGNWWSRYYAYEQEEYLNLMERFEKENIPITVATVDMDWHWVKGINDRFGTNYKAKNPITGIGWTGYSWNTDLFPDYKEFLRKLREKNLYVTLNLHPADGVRTFEDQYEEMAKAVGMDPKSGETVKFDIGSKRFMNAYFDVLHHPYEEQGVDFWWIDWQQGKKSTIKGVDPLWALNHYHYLDNCRNDRRGLILSRYCGIGSHRYPLGFSGDYVVSWKSLQYQPEFTNTAANIGYDWWSHDIGGHAFGISDDELYVRWCQYGVFSPINRLHSTQSYLQGKEPWKRSETARRIVSDYLRLRHKMLPYIYSEGRKTHENNVPICRPTYYDYPEIDLAYKYRNEYFFGSELLVCPITSKTSKKIGMAKTTFWLPEGRFTDIFTGRIYQGGRVVNAFRDLQFMPVLAKEGAIVPLSKDEGNSCANPKKMEVWAYAGNGKYELYEDDGKENGKFALTTFVIKEEGDTLTFKAETSGEKSVLPEERTYEIVFKDVKEGTAKVNGKDVPLDRIVIKDGDEVIVTDVKRTENPDFCEYANEIFSRLSGSNFLKMIKYMRLGKIKDKDELKKKLKHACFDKFVKEAATEE